MLFQHAFRSNRSLFKYGSAILYLNALAEHCTAQLSSFTHADLRQQDAALHAAVLPNPHTAACNRVSAEIGVVRNFGVRADVTWRSDNGALPYARAFFDEDALPVGFCRCFKCALSIQHVRLRCSILFNIADIAPIP